MGSGAIDSLTLGFFRLFSGRLGARVRNAQYEENRRAWEAYRKRHGEPMLERQSQLSAFLYGRTWRLWERVFLGGQRLTAAVNACEVVAVYNALQALGASDGASVEATAAAGDVAALGETAAVGDVTALGETADAPDEAAVSGGGDIGKDAAAGEEGLPELLRYFSAHGICAHGLFGTSPQSIERYFRERGFWTRGYAGRRITEETMAALEAACDVCIITCFNRGQNPFHMVHTMCATREPQGWRLHNDYEGGRVYASLYAAVTGYRHGESHPIRALGIGAGNSCR